MEKSIKGKIEVLRFSLLGVPNNVFILKGNKNRGVLVDCGMTKKDFTKIKNAIEKIDEIPFMIITHTHLDHIGNIARLMELKKFSKCKIILHNFALKNLVEGKQTLKKINNDCYSVIMSLFAKKSIPSYAYKKKEDLVSFPFEEEEDSFDYATALKEEFGIEILHTPGHTPGCISIWNKEANYIIIGDLINRTVFGNGIRLPFEVTSFPNLYKSYGLIFDLNPKQIFSCHYDGAITKEKLKTNFPKAFPKEDDKVEKKKE